MRQILVPVDFSPITAETIEHAARLAEKFGAEIALLHVAAPDPDFVGYETGPDTVREQVATELRTEHRELQAHAEALRARGLRAHAICVQGPTVATILERAERIGAELIVIGSHGHGALYRTLVGSVSEGILYGTTCPVLLVPARERTTSSAPTPGT